MRIDVITLFPGMIKDTFSYGVTGRAVKDKKVIFKTWDLKDFSEETHGRMEGDSAQQTSIIAKGTGE